MTFRIVPNELTEAINKLLDAELIRFPEILPEERKVLFDGILDYFDQFGELPSISVAKRPTCLSVAVSQNEQ